MTISTTCPGCGTQYTLSDAMAGKKAKCKKCGAVLTVPNPNEPLLAELADDPLAAGPGASSPLDGLSDKDFGGAPLGPAPRGPVAARGSAVPRRPAASSGEGVPKIVWIACGAGGGVCLLLLVLLLVFGGSSDDDQTPVAGAGANASSPGTPSGAGSPTGAAPAAAGTAASSPTPGASPATQAAEVDDSTPWKWQPERLPSARDGLLRQPLRLVDRPQDAMLTKPDVAHAILTFNRYGSQRDLLVQRLDLAAGKTVGEHSFAQYTKLLGASLDGTTSLVIPAESYAQQDTLELWRWSGAGAERVAQWKPYAGQSSPRIAWSLLLDTGRVLTYHSQDPAAIAWDAAKGTEVYRIACQSAETMFQSPGGKYLVHHSGLWLRFFQAADGKHVGSLGPLPADFISLGAVAFAPDGKTIAAMFSAPTGANANVALFDAAQGKLTKQIEVPPFSQPLQWLSDGYLLAGSYLVSLAHDMTVWNYSGLQPFSQGFDTRVWFAASAGSEQYLTAQAAPSPDVISKIDAFVAANTPVVKTGDTVSLQVTASGQSPKPDLQSQVTEAFRGKLAAAGYQIGDGQPFRLQVTVNEEDSGRQLEYRSFAAGPGSNTLQVPDRRVVCKAAFTDSSGKEVWQVSSTFGPAMMTFNRDGGDLVKQLLDSRWQSLDRWIEGLQIPKLVRRFSGTGKFGTSQLQPSGERILSVPTP